MQLTARTAERLRRLWRGFPDIVTMTVLGFAVLTAALALWP
jgi:hypothetical protein